MIRTIVFYPDPVLRRTGDRVTEVTAEIRQLAADMIETMYEANGVGLAAPQVGVSVQLAVIDVAHDEECVSYLRVNGEERCLGDICPLVFINPSLEMIGPKESSEEG
ncbi:MAG: peptide deformylase, partial [Verrucomicrobiales bacterium]